MPDGLTRAAMGRGAPLCMSESNHAHNSQQHRIRGADGSFAAPADPGPGEEQSSQRARRLARLPDPAVLARGALSRTQAYVNEQAFNSSLHKVACSTVMGKQVPNDEHLELRQDLAVTVQEAVNDGKVRQQRETGSVPETYLRAAAKGVVSRRGVLNSRELSAHKVFTAQLAIREQELGTTLTAAQQDALAHEVRMSIPVKNRPAEGFHRLRRMESLDTLAEALEAGWGEDAEPIAVWDRYGAEDPGDEMGGFVDAVEELVTVGRITTKDLHSAAAWDVLASACGAPRVVPRAVPADMISDALAMVRHAGGASALARRYADGEIADAPGLFVPFGCIAEEEELAVATLMVMIADSRGAAVMDELFEKAARDAATSSRSRVHERVGAALDVAAGRRERCLRKEPDL